MTPIKAGMEFQANTTEDSSPSKVATTALPDNGYIIVWEAGALAPNAIGTDIFGQRYHADGSADGIEFQVNNSSTYYQSQPAIGSFSDGGFLVAWEALGQNGPGSDIYIQRFHADGTADGLELKVNTYTPDTQFYATVTTFIDDSYLITWTSEGQDNTSSNYGIYGQRYNADGTADGAEFLINTTTDRNQSRSTVEAFSDGRFVVVWQSNEQDGSIDGIFGQRFSANGMKSGAEFQINTHTTNNQWVPSVNALSDNGFVVTWQSDHQDGSGAGVYGQKFNDDGTANGSEFLINTTTSSHQSRPSVTALTEGRFIVVWDSFDPASGYTDVFGQYYNADGSSNGSEFLVNTFTDADLFFPTVDALSATSFLVTWQAGGPATGIFGQRFAVDSGVPADFTENSDIAFLPAGGGIYHALDGDDLVEGSLDSDVLYGESGDDTFFGGQGNDIFDGGANTDTIDYSNSLKDISINLVGEFANGLDIGSDTLINVENVVAGVGDDVIQGSYGNNFIAGGEGHDALYGRPGNDVLYGGTGFDKLWGQEGDDTLVGSFQADWMNGGTGIDTADYSASNNAQKINLYTNVNIGGLAHQDKIVFIENVIGSDTRKDDITGSNHDNILSGMGADDILRGYHGNDTLNGGEGNDFLFGGTGSDILDGGNGLDWAMYNDAPSAVTINLLKGQGSWGEAQGDTYVSVERARGSEFNDRIFGSNDNNKLFGDMGDDEIRGLRGKDILSGGQGNDTLNGGIGNDSMRGDSGQDTFIYGANSGNDFIMDFKEDVDQIHLDKELWDGDLTVEQVVDNYLVEEDPYRFYFNFGDGNVLHVLTDEQTLVSQFYNDVEII